MLRKIFAMLMVLAICMITVVSVSAQDNGDPLPPPADVRGAADVGAMNLPGGGWWTGIQVVNIGTGDATIIVTLYTQGSAATYVSAAKVVEPNNSYTFSPFTNADWDPDIPDGFIGSAVVSADQPILGIVNEQNNLVSGGVAGASYRGFTSDDTANRLLYPLVKRVYGSSQNTTTYFVQNASDSAANVYATFRVAGGTFTHQYLNVGANQVVTINPAEAGVPTGSGSLGSLEVTSTVKLAGMYNEHKDSATVATSLFGTSGFAPTMGSTRLFAPLYKQDYNTAYTGLQVMNTGGVTATIYATYTLTYGGTGNYYAHLDAGPGKSATFFNVAGWPANTFGSVVVTANQPLVAIANETKYSTGQSGVYAAFPESELTNCAVAPLWKTRWSGTTSGQQSALVVQNVGAITATVHVTFTMSLGGVGTFTPASRLVGPGQSTTYGPGAFAGGPPTGTAAVGSVEICSTLPIAVLAQETTLPGFTIRDMLNYEGFNK